MTRRTFPTTCLRNAITFFYMLFLHIFYIKHHCKRVFVRRFSSFKLDELHLRHRTRVSIESMTRRHFPPALLNNALNTTATGFWKENFELNQYIVNGSKGSNDIVSFCDRSSCGWFLVRISSEKSLQLIVDHSNAVAS